MKPEVAHFSFDANAAADKEFRPVRTILNRSRPTLRHGTGCGENWRVRSDPRERTAFCEVCQVHGAFRILSFFPSRFLDYRPKKPGLLIRWLL